MTWLKKEYILVLLVLALISVLPANVLYSRVNVRNHVSELNYEFFWKDPSNPPSYLLTPDLWINRFLFEVELLEYGPYTRDIVNRSVHKYQLGEITEHHPFQSEIGEWGYSFHHLYGLTDGSGRYHDGKYPKPPDTREEALGHIRDYLLSILENISRPWAAFNGHYPYHHYAAEWGYDVIGSEIGENINNYQMLLAFNRGAARQYQKSWFIDVSAWMQGGITDYSEFKPWGESGGPNKGHSLSLYRRCYYMSYMGGTKSIVAEAGGVNFLLDSKDEDDCFIPSPLGYIGQEFYNFSRNFPDPGVPYTPYAILLDHNHGSYPGFGRKLALDFFKYSQGDKMSYKWLDIFFPGGWEIRRENDVLVNSQYGDTCDILLQNAPLECLKSYPVIIPSGEIQFSISQIEDLLSYTDAGGILVLNQAYLPQFPEDITNSLDSTSLYEQRDWGEGSIIIYGPEYNPKVIGPTIIQELNNLLLPFRIEGDIQFMINRKEASWVLTLMNNNGIRKPFDGIAKINRKKVSEIIIYFNPIQEMGDSNGVLDTTIYSNNINLELVSNNLWKTKIPPGEIIIIEFKL
ncbi:MAG: hypothetical protein HGN29_04300 [Asgard group archaeon]|nr:hypothetical protein [Asgard group archaeon]